VDDEGYLLLDAGEGRRLERFGSQIVDRPAAAAEEAALDPNGWAAATLRFFRYAGWKPPAAALEPWQLRIAGLTLELRATDTGQVGVFPEQAPNWEWLRRQIAEPGADSAPRRMVLNLFAYTGVATLVAAAAGAAVAHVDGSRPAVAWARRNADLSGLADAPVRWLVDDAEAFVARERRRGRRYDGFVLDPPSYGHAAGGRTWRLEERLGGLLESCAALAAPDAFIVLTAHTPGFDGPRLADAIAASFGTPRREIESGQLSISARSGAGLALGGFARWPRSRGSRG
jgi:23S rRNA (cytosine1962-C5)-methyltransferase